MENLRNRIDVRLVSSKKRLFKMDIKTKLYITKIFDNDLVGIRKNKVTLTLIKPAYVEMCVLDLSKVLMYDFHYDCIKNKYGSNSRLLFTDFESLMYKIKTGDIYQDFDLILVVIQLSQCIMMIQTN